MPRKPLAGLVLATALGTTFGAAELAAQSQWNWQGRIENGRTIEIVGVNGEIRAVPGSGNETRVAATKSGRRSDPDEVRIVVLEHGSGVTICAVYPTPSGQRQENACAPGGGRNNTRNNDVKVDFAIEVPAGVNFAGKTVNGSIEADGLAGSVEANTVNGSLKLSATSITSARTVNGSIDASLRRADWRDRARFESVNGRVRVAIAGELNADIRASTVNGNIDSDFPVMVQGRFGPRSMNGTIGNGGRVLEMKTVNGSIELRRM
jgi:DUF4097 and DUF4098 domain-containing protein YvlB